MFFHENYDIFRRFLPHELSSSSSINRLPVDYLLFSSTIECFSIQPQRKEPQRGLSQRLASSPAAGSRGAGNLSTNVRWRACCGYCNQTEIIAEMRAIRRKQVARFIPDISQSARKSGNHCRRYPTVHYHLQTRERILCSPSPTKSHRTCMSSCGHVRVLYMYIYSFFNSAVFLFNCTERFHVTTGGFVVAANRVWSSAA